MTNWRDAPLSSRHRGTPLSAVLKLLHDTAFPEASQFRASALIAKGFLATVKIGCPNSSCRSTPSQLVATK